MPIEWTGPAVRDMRRLDRQVQRRIIQAISRFDETNEGDVIPLRGEPGWWRLRVGQWRVLFTREPGLLRVERVLPRDQAYR